VDGTDQAKVAATYVMGQFLLQAVNSSGNRNLEDYARRSLDSRYVNNALAMAKGHIYVSADKLDQDPYLLNCANGTWTSATRIPGLPSARIAPRTS